MLAMIKIRSDHDSGVEIMFSKSMPLWVPGFLNLARIPGL